MTASKRAGKTKEQIKDKYGPFLNQPIIYNTKKPKRLTRAEHCALEALYAARIGLGGYLALTYWPKAKVSFDLVQDAILRIEKKI